MKKPETSGYQYLFGPVPSRRLGISLGVDLLPHKTCSLDCVYCECGRTTHLTVKRKEYVSLDGVREELSRFLSSRPRLDYITFSGGGEPTLHSGIGEIIRFLKTDYPQYRVALLTNGTLFYQDGLVEAVSTADVIAASLDAATPEDFRKVNRPHPALDPAAVVAGLKRLRSAFAGQLWLEVFLVAGLNDSRAALSAIKKTIHHITPDKIQLNTLDRPGTEAWVQALDDQALAAAGRYLGGVEQISRAGIRSLAPFGPGDEFQTVLKTLKRRPCTADDISRILGMPVERVLEHLEALAREGRVTRRHMLQGDFFSAPS